MLNRAFFLFCLLMAVAPSGSTKDKPNVYDHVVTMNGQPIHYDALPINSQGVLAFVSGYPGSPKHKPMLFQVTLRRAGTAIQQWPQQHRHGVYSVQLNDIWPFVQLGDELVVEPVYGAGETYKPGKRIFKLGMINLFTWNKC